MLYSITLHVFLQNVARRNLHLIQKSCKTRFAIICIRIHWILFTVDLIQKGKYNPKRTVQMVSDLTQVGRACSLLKDKLTTTQEYVEDVLVSIVK